MNAVLRKLVEYVEDRVIWMHVCDAHHIPWKHRRILLRKRLTRPMRLAKNELIYRLFTEMNRDWRYIAKLMHFQGRDFDREKAVIRHLIQHQASLSRMR